MGEDDIEFNKENLLKSDNEIYSSIKTWQKKAKPLKWFIKGVLVMGTFISFYTGAYIYTLAFTLLWIPDSLDIIKFFKYKVFKYEEVEKEEI